jgi:thymidine kinase
MKKEKIKKSCKRCGRQYENYKVFVPEFKTLICNEQMTVGGTEMVSKICPLCLRSSME